MKEDLQQVYGFNEARLRKNGVGYFQELAPYLVLLLAAAFADFLSTYRFMLAGSIEDELHPVIRLFSLYLGPLFGPLLGKVGQVTVAIFLSIWFRPGARILLTSLSIIYFYAAWYNTWGIDLYTPRFMSWLGG
ncbi:MAG: hypothetical protein L3J39_17310 [Verrucomicrobiales bacterium]|nr:hypothetical protein [Verrucomicrobiales bacterium]